MYYIFNSALHLTDIGIILIYHGMNYFEFNLKKLHAQKQKTQTNKKTRILISFRNKLGWERYYKN